jgi:hypothetical protein
MIQEINKQPSCYLTPAKSGDFAERVNLFFN